MTAAPELGLAAALVAVALVFAAVRLARSLDAIGVQLTRIARAVLGEEGGQDQKATVPAASSRALEAAQELARRRSA